MNDIVLRALIGVCFLLALMGACFLARRDRRVSRNIRRESGNTIERRPNVRRPRDAEIRALVSAPPMSPTPTVVVPAWTDASWDEPTLTSPRGEA